MPEITTLPILNDNYAYALVDGDDVVIIDPGAAEPINEFLEGKNLVAILITHHHDDHIAGIAGVRAEHACRLIAPSDERIEGIDETAIEGKPLSLLGLDMTVIATPGHTRSHLTYYIPALSAAFTGDALFSAGCGRLFEGTAGEMYTSLKKIADLPDETKLYFGHEYTEKNLLFAHDIEPDNQAVSDALAHFHVPSTPTTVAKEKAINLFLRAKSPVDLKALRLKKNEMG